MFGLKSCRPVRLSACDLQAEMLRLCARIGYSPHHS